ncbi:MAG: hypothetical protein ACJA1A_003358 [Saprospiraceae bacterium]|jgi:hypothetical protein
MESIVGTNGHVKTAYMKKILLLQAIIEIIAGVVIIFKPDLLLMSEGQVVETLIVAKLYGILALTFGVVCLMLCRVYEYNDTFKKIVLMVMFFHLMVAFQMYAAYNQGAIPNLGAFGLHMILAVLLFGAYMKNINRFSTQKNEIVK